MSNDQIKYWVLPLHLRIHQITTKHCPVVLNEDYERLREEVAGLKRDMDTYYGSECERLRRELAEAREILKYLRAILPGDVWADDARRMIDAVLAADQSAG